MNAKSKKKEAPFHIAQIGLPCLRSNGKPIKGFTAQEGIDYFTEIDSFVLPMNRIYSIAELSGKHAEKPYDTVRIELPFLPDDPNHKMPVESYHIILTAVEFAQKEGLPFYFHTANETMPAQLTARIAQQEATIQYLQEQAMRFDQRLRCLPY